MVPSAVGDLLQLTATTTAGSTMVVIAEECTPLFRCLKSDEQSHEEGFDDDPFADV